MAKEIQLKAGSDNAYPHPFWPVGAIYISVVNENPSKYFGGTWQSFGAGRCLVGVDTSQTEFNSVQKTGGSKSVALTVNQMPSHNHSFSGSSGSAGSHTHELKGYEKATASGSSGYRSGGGGTASAGDIILSAGAHTHSISGTVGYNGSGESHTNLQPYITVYMWRRTA